MSVSIVIKTVTVFSLIVSSANPSNGAERPKPCDSLEEVYADEQDCGLYIEPLELSPRRNDYRHGGLDGIGIDPESEEFSNPDKETLKVLEWLEGTWCQKIDRESVPRYRVQIYNGAIVSRSRFWPPFRKGNSPQTGYQEGSPMKIAVQAVDGGFRTEDAVYVTAGIRSRANIEYNTILDDTESFVRSEWINGISRYIYAKSKQNPYYKCDYRP